jgi:DNA-binding MarR family transcriptional regulator
MIKYLNHKAIINIMQALMQKRNMVIQSETRAAALFLHVAAQHMNIQFTDIRCLNYLMDHPRVTAGDIAKITGLTTGAVTAMLDRLEEASFIKRQSDMDDRRKVIITLKSDNFTKVNTIHSFFDNDVKNLLSNYSKKEQLLIRRWNEDMTKILKQKTDQLSGK